MRTPHHHHLAALRAHRANLAPVVLAHAYDPSSAIDPNPPVVPQDPVVSQVPVEEPPKVKPDNRPRVKAPWDDPRWFAPVAEPPAVQAPVVAEALPVEVPKPIEPVVVPQTVKIEKQSRKHGKK